MDLSFHKVEIVDENPWRNRSRIIFIKYLAKDTGNRNVFVSDVMKGNIIITKTNFNSSG